MLHNKKASDNELSQKKKKSGGTNSKEIKIESLKENIAKEDTYNIEEKKRKEILMKCEELQKKELEALKLIYVLNGELNIKNENDKEKHTIIHIQLNDQNINDNIINLTFELPKDYPLNSFLIINICVKNFSTDMNNYINDQIYKYIQNYFEQECILHIIYKVNELVENIQNKKEVIDNSDSSSDEKIGKDDKNSQELINNIPLLYYKMPYSHQSRILSRRLCYSHHILSLIKRSYILKWAKELNIGGYSKIGYPGIIICEGPKEEVDFYINSLNKLRWKHFDCRGMEDIKLNEYEDLDEARVLPKSMYELDSKGMSTLSNICTECGLRDLFLTSMKIYNTNGKHVKSEKSKNLDKNNEENLKINNKGKKKKKK
ncbi:conserved Plasmodium protein, unknown function [Plasmodium gallinaceum]|uniref:RWD domain-containing protein n=1 Tax=Plasmodium gallinaceum TaxID=5849 RepID=A0A1J1GNA1_PLAGA|nr:conserved Plasmodium protein, unknown function [Plasmodium gallinaceum]CRG93914.1 conserved Plasmodium protein, unknown function [Plasmodium gallinaceum]